MFWTTDHTCLLEQTHWMIHSRARDWREELTKAGNRARDRRDSVAKTHFFCPGAGGGKGGGGVAHHETFSARNNHLAQNPHKSTDSFYLASHILSGFPQTKTSIADSMSIHLGCTIFRDDHSP